MAYSTISKPSLYFNTVLYTGNSSTQNVDVGFASDWQWIKSRTTTQGHTIYDNVRGQFKVINSHVNNAEATETGGFTGMSGNNMQFNGDNAVRGDTNYSGTNYVAWNWKANGAGSANTDGSINSTVSVNTTAGFSISSYTGTGSAGTIGHGLGSTPKMIIVKKRSGAANWYTYHQSLGNDKRLSLNETDASATDNNAWNQTTPTSSVFSVGASGTTNASGATTIAYCFAEKKGFSKFGKYIGNGDAKGTFVYTGFKPAWVLFKNTTDSGDNWIIHDNKRDTFNVTDNGLAPNTSGAEFTDVDIDLLSNGFKIRNNTGRANGSGKNYIYMAFAEEPLVANVGNSIPATAR